MSVGSISEAITGTSARAGARLDAAITDFFLPGDGRLDDAVRIALTHTLHSLIAGLEADIRRHAGRLLAGRGQADDAAALLSVEGGALPALIDAGLLRDPDLMEELIAHSRVDLIADGLPSMSGDTNHPSLLVRLADLPDTIVASAARALLVAESSHENAPILPAELQHRLVWWIAAAIETSLPADVNRSRALAEAAQRSLAAYDEGERTEAVAERLVAAIDPLPGEVPALLVEAIGDGRLVLVAALLARALGIDADTARTLLIEPDDERLWSALRVAGLARDEIAQIGLSLATADPRRDIELFADRLDDVMAQKRSTARAILAPLTLPRELRIAARLLTRRRR